MFTTYVWPFLVMIYFFDFNKAIPFLGITNHEEYSLIHEKGRAQTLRRPKNASRDYDKLETLKHKLQTDDGGGNNNSRIASARTDVS